MNRETEILLPKYMLKVKDIKQDSNIITFGIFLQHLNPDEAAFEYAGGQYFLETISKIAPTETLNYSILESQLPFNMSPRNPSIGTLKDSESAIFRLAVNTFPGAGNGYKIASCEPGTLIAKMKLMTTENEFANEAKLKWRKAPTVIYATKIFAYVGLTNTDVSYPDNFIVELPNLISS